MSYSLKRVSALLLGTLLLIAAAAPAIAAGNDITTDVYLQNTLSISGVSQDMVLLPGGGTTLSVAAQGAGLSYLWEISTDGGSTWADAPGAQNTSAYVITDAQKNDPETTPYFYRVTVTDSFGETGSEIIRVLVCDDYEYATRADVTHGVKVAGFLRKTARLIVARTETASSALRQMVRPGYAPLAAYEVCLRTAEGVVLPAYFGQLDITFTAETVYNGQTLNVYHQMATGEAETLRGVVAAGELSVTVRELSPFLIEVDASTLLTISVSRGAGGEVSPSGTVYVPAGSDETFVFTPQSGYVLDAVTLDGIPVSISGNSYTLTDIQADHALHATFRKPSPPSSGGGGDGAPTYTITIPAADNGRASPTGKVTAEYGESFTIYFYPDEGYMLNQVLVNGTEVSPGSGSYTFTVTGDAAVKGSFKLKTVTPPIVTRTIAATAGSNGSVSPAGITTVARGGDLRIYFLPDDGYEVDTVTVNGVEADAEAHWHFINVQTDHSIHVTFKAEDSLPAAGPVNTSSGQPEGELPAPPGEPDNNPSGTINSDNTQPGSEPGNENSEYAVITIEIDGAAHGKISPSGEIIVEPGGDQTIYFYPEDGYRISRVLVDGVGVDAHAGSYTMEDISGGEHSIIAAFEPIEAQILPACACAVCGFWRSVFPSLGCACPWCWLIPLLLFRAVNGYGAWRKKSLTTGRAQER